MHTFLANFKKELADQPTVTLGVVTAAALAAAKIIDTLAGARSKNAYAKQVKTSNAHRRYSR